MKILLISVNTLTSPYPVYPIGLDYVAGAIVARHEVRILDLNDENDPHILAETLQNFVPDVIGLSIRNIDTTDFANRRGFVEQYRQLVMIVRSLSQAVIVLGGSGFTIFPEAMMSLLEADFGLTGDGEWFGLLIDALEKGGDVSKIPGIRTTGNFTLPPEPWEEPFARGFNPENPHVSFYLKTGGMLNLQTKRGCPYKCIYCTYPRIDGRKLRLIPPEQVARTARQLQEVGARYLFITDSTFNSSPEHSLDVAKAFIREKIGIPWGGFFAPLAPPEDYYTIMAEAGLRHVEFGTESLSDPMLRTYQKPFQAADVLQAHEKATAAGLHVAHYLLLGGPGEDEKSITQTLGEVDKITKAAFFFFCGVRIYPFTDLHRIALEEGQVSPSQTLLEPVYYQSRNLSSDDIIGQVRDRASGRQNWIIGSGGDHTARVIARLHGRGRVGPLWEKLIP